MKLGGLTWWRNNYGSILQAYALQTILNSYENIEYEIICQYGKNILSIDNFVDKIKTIGLIKTVKRFFWKICVPKLKKRTNCIQRFVDGYLRVSKKTYSIDSIKEANQVYDGFVCGSDQIWNVELTDVDSMYWLRFADQDKIKFAYAPSIGVDKLTIQQSSKIRMNLKDYIGISCREKSGTELINEVLNENRCVTVVDPTLVVTRDVWDGICSKNKIDTPYIFVYLLRGTKEWRKQIEYIAEKKKMKIVTIPFLDNEYIVPYDILFGDEKCWETSPSDFISLIRNASFVFTDSFHCMVFSCIYHVSFWVYPKIGKAQMSRIQELQNMLKLQNRIIEKDISDINMEEKINWEIVDKQIDTNRKFAIKYLDGILTRN